MENTARILLINAINPHIEVEARYPSLGLAYLASSVRKYLPQANIEFKITDRNIKRIAGEFSPDLVGISSVSQNFNIAQDYAEYFADKGIPVIMGGIHISCLPECLPRSSSAGCLGEGEYSFARIVKAYLDNSLSPETFAGIPGIVFRENGRLNITAQDQSERNLDDIPVPDRSLLPIGSHTYMFTSRGCPYRCVFCASSRFWSKLRFFSAEYVVDEIGLLMRDYKVKLISFFDDLFIANRNRLERILILLERKRILGKMKFTCNCRANLVDRELAKILFRMGVVSANMGLESGDNETLRFLKGGLMSTSDNHKAIAFLKDAGISVNGSFVIGSPHEGREQIMRTYDFIKKSNMDLFDVYLLTPFPGTPIWDYAKKRNLVSEDMSEWSRLNMNAYSMPEKRIILLSEVLTKKELLLFYKKFLALRFRRNLIKVFTHPMLVDLPGMSYNLLKEFFYHFFRKWV